MAEKTDESAITFDLVPEGDLPPCGCAIGDLLALQTETDLPMPEETLGDQSGKQAETDLPPCGCVIGDLLENQVEAETPPSDGVTTYQAKRR